MPCDKLFVPYLVYNAYVYTPWVAVLVHPVGKLERSSTDVELHLLPSSNFAVDTEKIM